MKISGRENTKGLISLLLALALMLSCLYGIKAEQAVFGARARHMSASSSAAVVSILPSSMPTGTIIRRNTLSNAQHLRANSAGTVIPAGALILCVILTILAVYPLLVRCARFSIIKYIHDCEDNK